jgi:hypothetical protein
MGTDPGCSASETFPKLKSVEAAKGDRPATGL